MRISLLLASAVAIAACNVSTTTPQGTRAVQGQLADSVQQAVIFSETTTGQHTVGAVAPNGQFILSVPTHTVLTLVVAAPDGKGGFVGVKHIGPQLFTLEDGPTLN